MNNELKNTRQYNLDLMKTIAIISGDRRMKTGVGEEAATSFVDYSDMLNVRLCLTKTMPADLQLAVDSNGEYTKTK